MRPNSQVGLEATMTQGPRSALIFLLSSMDLAKVTRLEAEEIALADQFSRLFIVVCRGTGNRPGSLRRPWGCRHRGRIAWNLLSPR